MKQANVGLALLAGHANTNTTTEIGSTTAIPATTTSTTALTTTAEESLNKHEKELQKRNDKFNLARVAHMKQFQAAYQKIQALELQEQIKVQ